MTVLWGFVWVHRGAPTDGQYAKLSPGPSPKAAGLCCNAPMAADAWKLYKHREREKRDPVAEASKRKLCSRRP